MPSWHTLIDASATPLGGGRRYIRVALHTQDDGAVHAAWPGAQGMARLSASPTAKGARGARGKQAAAGAVANHVAAPMAARVLAVRVHVGDRLASQAPLVVLEAMKMEHTVRAPHSGRRVAKVCVTEGDFVAHGQILVTFDDAPDTEAP